MPTMVEILDRLDPIEKDILSDVLEECSDLPDNDVEEELVATLEGEDILYGEQVEEFARYIVWDLKRQL